MTFLIEIMKYILRSSTEPNRLIHFYSFIFFVNLTVRFLETVAPLVVGQLSVFKGVAGVEQRTHAQLVFVKVNGAEL